MNSQEKIELLTRIAIAAEPVLYRSLTAVGGTNQDGGVIKSTHTLACEFFRNGIKLLSDTINSRARAAKRVRGSLPNWAFSRKPPS